jgi:hypothetical protein
LLFYGLVEFCILQVSLSGGRPLLSGGLGIGYLFLPG